MSASIKMVTKNSRKKIFALSLCLAFSFLSCSKPQEEPLTYSLSNFRFASEGFPDIANGQEYFDSLAILLNGYFEDIGLGNEVEVSFEYSKHYYKSSASIRITPKGEKLLGEEKREFLLSVFCNNLNDLTDSLIETDPSLDFSTIDVKRNFEELIKIIGPKLKSD